MGRFIYLIKWIISRAQDPHSGWSRRGTAQGGEGVWWVGFLAISKYFIKYIAEKYTYEKGENLKVRSTEEYWCQFGFIHWPFFRGRRQGRQLILYYIILYYRFIYIYNYNYIIEKRNKVDLRVLIGDQKNTESKLGNSNSQTFPEKKKGMRPKISWPIGTGFPRQTKEPSSLPVV